VSLIASLVFLTLAVLPLPASAWNIPGHMLSAAIAYQVLSQESPQTIEKVKAVLEKHPSVRRPMVHETSKCARCWAWPGVVYAGSGCPSGQVESHRNTTSRL